MTNVAQRAGFSGVFNVLATPFTERLDVDARSIKSLVSGVLSAGVDGITVLGVAGEVHRLTENERVRVIHAVIEAVNDQVPVIVGTSHNDTSAAVNAAVAARRVGAAGLMIAPPHGMRAGSVLADHYCQIADSAQLPIVFQDYPAVSGVDLSPQDMADLLHAVPSITTIKLESIPTPLRTAQMLALLPAGGTILGGLGAVYFLDELRHGSAGTMTGFAYPEALKCMYDAYRSGDTSTADAVYMRFRRLLEFEGQPGVGLAIRKEVLRRRGFISHAAVRPPGAHVDDRTAADLTKLLDGVDQA